MNEMTGAAPAAAEGSRRTRLAVCLREVREYLGLSQQFVAEHTGISRVAISDIENDKRRVEALELAALASLYSYPVTYFLDGALEESASVKALAREAQGLSDADREEVLRFAQFLKSYGKERGSIGKSLAAED